MKTQFIHEFQGFNGFASKCHIRVLDDADKPLVILCSQMASNLGTSVTNVAEILAQDFQTYLGQNNLTLGSAIQGYVKESRFTKMLDDLLTKLKDTKNLTLFTLESIKLALQYREQHAERSRRIREMIWVEHYAPGLGIDPKGSYAIVTFEPGSWRPSWKYLPRPKLATITKYEEGDFLIPDSELMA
jgi:hypothetical protein